MAQQLNLGVLEVSGADAANFLQGQFSNDINELVSWQISLNLNNKGRVLVTAIILKQEEKFYLVVPKNLILSTLNRLKLFVLRSKVQISISQLFAHIRTASYQQRLAEEAVCQLDDNYELVISENSAENCFLQDFLITNKLAFVYPETSGLYTASDLGHDERTDRFKSISYTKGCYIGQEIVARVHYLGSPKSGIYRFCSKSTANLNEAVHDQEGKPIGRVLEYFNFKGLLNLKHGAKEVYLKQELISYG